ncbi:SDR family NAD(P)-dependent oxidoreductase [Flavobacterium urocaniciphilum]|uniref:NADP-dependent 3-hydroxy acid dehydrogenase YdfG n=1 Tax=Flavobacterium urocaniciphilum TaxID=1299341 RepID=A0A1H9AE51_9FLAO|nr:SDR family NAD(P)-dependent oxidoreductase [Flavobacterium urocaniciphilum]SEP74865.1 NADP-dependent 3-hydroxy acid dehydrogenase YdfG [Flavobacterium urocaniciphilum]
MKTVLITGAGGGIGKQTAIYFAKNNWNVLATSLHLDHTKDIKHLPNIYCYELDVTCSESITNASKIILENHPKIDTIINNAGIGYRSFVELSEDEKIDDIVKVNWLGVVKMCRAFIPVFRQQNFGQFINITSVAGLVNLPLGNFYHSTKQAVESFSECMAYELIDFNISVSTVQFGNAPTSFQSNVTKCGGTEICSYNKLMDKISTLLENKSGKNADLPQQIVEKLFSIAENPNKSFRRYTIGFDANLMKILRRRLGYRMFNFIIRRFTL